MDFPLREAMIYLFLFTLFIFQRAPQCTFLFRYVEIACHISLFSLPSPCVARVLHYFPFFFLKWMSLLPLCTHFHKTRYLSKYLHDKHKLLWMKPVFNSFYYCIARTPKHSQSKNYKILTRAQSISLQKPYHAAAAREMHLRPPGRAAMRASQCRRYMQALCSLLQLQAKAAKPDWKGTHHESVQGLWTIDVFCWRHYKSQPLCTLRHWNVGSMFISSFPRRRKRQLLECLFQPQANVLSG